jgi:two-component system sensor histidine kinase HydH
VSLAPIVERPLAHGARAWMLERAIRMRLVIAPVMASLAISFGLVEPTPWRRLAVAGSVTLLLSLSLIEWLRYRRRGLTVVHLPLNLLLTLLGQLNLMVASGGLFSPVVLAPIPMVIITALLGDRRTLLWMFALVLPVLWALAFVHHFGWPWSSLLPEIYGGAQALERGPAPWVAAGFETLALIAVARVTLALQKLMEQLFHEATAERDRTLALHAEQSRTLTLLTSEIAHELKNPLASIKGLAALVSRSVSGREGERMAVLRGEVDRMQSILEEFLTLSRPLVPLVVAQVDLRQVAHDVLRLHEGMSLERGVKLELEGADEAPLRCDLRKVRQVLINLVQNALDASPRGSTVKLRLEIGAEQARAQVIDQGPGLSGPMLECAFEAGVTNKAQGSGIGLVVARSLARQHGGEVALAPGAREGLIATLTLPREPRGVNP